MKTKVTLKRAVERQIEIKKRMRDELKKLAEERKKAKP